MPFKTLKRGLVLLACAIVSACVAPPPQPEQPGRSLPDQFPSAERAPTESALTAINADQSWPDVFTDPDLKTLIQSALDHNSDLKAASAKVAEARAMYGIQDSGRFPTLGAGAEGTRSRVPADLSITQQAQTTGQYQAGLGVTAYELDFWGRVSSLSDAALAQYLATEEAREAFRISLIALVANTYLQALEFNERIALAKKTLATREESMRIMQRRVDLGSSSDLDLRSVQSLLVSARAELAVLERSREQNEALIQELTGHSDVSISSLARLDAQGLDRDVPPGLPSELLVRRPDIRAAEQQLIAARASVDAARAAFLPRITLTGFAGTASNALDGLFRGASGAWSFMPSISTPLFDGGLTQSNLALAEARKHLAVANYEATIRTAFREVADALAAHHWLAVQEDAQLELVQAESERARLSSIRYDQGSASFLDVLDSQRSQFAAEQMLIQVRRARMASTVALYKALGGGQSVSDNDSLDLTRAVMTQGSKQ